MESLTANCRYNVLALTPKKITKEYPELLELEIFNKKFTWQGHSGVDFYKCLQYALVFYTPDSVLFTSKYKGLSYKDKQLRAIEWCNLPKKQGTAQLVDMEKQEYPEDQIPLYPEDVFVQVMFSSLTDWTKIQIHVAENQIKEFTYSLITGQADIQHRDKIRKQLNETIEEVKLLYSEMYGKQHRELRDLHESESKYRSLNYYISLGNQKNKVW